MTRVHAREFIESAVEAKQIFSAGRGLLVGIVEADGNVLASAPLSGVAAASRLNQDLAHGPCGDALEVQARGRSDFRRLGHLHPSFIDEGGGIERGAGIAATHAGGEPPQLFVSRTKQVVYGVAVFAGQIQPRGPRGTLW